MFVNKFGKIQAQIMEMLMYLYKKTVDHAHVTTDTDNHGYSS